jgi:hypothetical protein
VSAPSAPDLALPGEICSVVFAGQPLARHSQAARHKRLAEPRPRANWAAMGLASSAPVRQAGSRGSPGSGRGERGRRLAFPRPRPRVELAGMAKPQAKRRGTLRLAERRLRAGGLG